jgi:hypothetical protein
MRPLPEEDNMQGFVMMGADKAACLAASSTALTLRARPKSASGELLSLEDDGLCARMRKAFPVDERGLLEGVITVQTVGEESIAVTNAKASVSREDIELRFTVALEKVPSLQHLNIMYNLTLS